MLDADIGAECLGLYYAELSSVVSERLGTQAEDGVTKKEALYPSTVWRSQDAAVLPAVSTAAGICVSKRKYRPVGPCNALISNYL